MAWNLGLESWRPDLVDLVDFDGSDNQFKMGCFVVISMYIWSIIARRLPMKGSH